MMPPGLGILPLCGMGLGWSCCRNHVKRVARRELPRPLDARNHGFKPGCITPPMWGLCWVVDTNGGAILGFKVDGQGPRQVARIPWATALRHRLRRHPLDAVGSR